MGFNTVKVQAAQANANGGGYTNLVQASVVASRLFEVDVYNSSGNTYYIQIHDSASAPTGVTTLRALIPVPTKSYGTATFSGKPFLNGIYVVVSTTDTTFTESGADDCLIDVDYTAAL